MKCRVCKSDINAKDEYCRVCGTIIKEKTNTVNKSLATSSIILGVLSITVGVIFVPLGIIGLVLGICEKEKCPERTLGIVLNTIGVVITIIVWSFFLVLSFGPSKYIKEFKEELKYNDVVIDDDSFLEKRIDSMKNWNLYKHLRSDYLGKKKVLKGGWRRLDNSSRYVKFKKEKFYSYSDINDMDDNYMSGNYELVDFDYVNLDQNRIMATIEESNGTIKYEDFYLIKFIPNKVISNGLDKTSISLEENQYWYELWILIDHGKEGIEAQAVNLDKDISTYYVKLED